MPALTGPVIDQTGTLSASDKAGLETQLQTLEQTRGAQVVVLMVPTTAPEDIASFANRVGNTWKIGRRDVGDGVLVIVAKNDRKMRIEVAKALEGAIPDIAAARIIDGAMKPRFQQSDYAGGLRDAVTQISARIAGEALPAPASNSGTAAHSPDTSRDGFDWTDLAIFLFFGVMVAGPVMRSIFGSRLGGLLMGGGVGLLAFVVTSSLIVAGGAGLLALLYTWIFGGTGGGSSRRRGRGGAAVGGWGAGVGGGGWSGGGSSSDSGGFSSIATLPAALWRLARHRWGEPPARRALPGDTLERLAARVAASEQQHTGQIRIVAEASLPWSYLRRNASARERALMLFSKYRVWDTEHNNGVLIYLLLPEHAIEIVADRGLARHVAADEWRDVIALMAPRFRQEQYEEGLAQAVDAVSLRLARHFPRLPDTPGHNELPDAPVLR